MTRTLARHHVRRVVLWIALVPFLLVSLAPPRHLPMGRSTALASLGEFVVLCTPDGMKLWRIGDETPASGRKPVTTGRVCPLCLSLQLAGLAVLPPVTVLPAPPTAYFTVVPILAELGLVNERPPSARPRAPPNSTAA